MYLLSTYIRQRTKLCYRQGLGSISLVSREEQEFPGGWFQVLLWLGWLCRDHGCQCSVASLEPSYRSLSSYEAVQGWSRLKGTGDAGCLPWGRNGNLVLDGTLLPVSVQLCSGLQGGGDLRGNRG